MSADEAKVSGFICSINGVIRPVGALKTSVSIGFVAIYVQLKKAIFSQLLRAMFYAVLCVQHIATLFVVTTVQLLQSPLN